MQVIMDGKTTKKQIYKHEKNYWNDLFPLLPSYGGFVQRVNKLSDVFVAMVNRIQAKLPQDLFDSTNPRLIDSMPIILAHRGRRYNAQVAPELADKGGYCATKKLHYYGVKLHILGSAQYKSLPIPEIVHLTKANVADITVYEQILPDILEYDKFADKAYISQNTHHTKTYTPLKKEKEQEFLDAADQLYSTAVSRIRQPIESLFSWIEEKVKIQIASKVRSSNALMVHVFGKLAVAFTLLNAKFSS